jgi:hypothetical protein
MEFMNLLMQQMEFIREDFFGDWDESDGSISLLWKPAYLTRAIMFLWTQIGHAQHPMTEDEAIRMLKQLLKMTPSCAAWITAQHLQAAIIMRWEKMVVMITDLLEHRQDWFTPDGEYHYLAIDGPDHYQNEYLAMQIDHPIAALNGPLCPPHYLTQCDSHGATAVNDLVLEEWLSQASDQHRNPLIQVLSRAWASSTAQWLVEESQSFYQKLQADILGTVAHSGQYTFTTVLSPCYAPQVEWHSRDTSRACPKCAGLESMLPRISPAAPLTPLGQVLRDAKEIRRHRISGVWWCASRLLTILYCHRAYAPGGPIYLKALADFTARCSKCQK